MSICDLRNTIHLWFLQHQHRYAYQLHSVERIQIVHKTAQKTLFNRIQIKIL